METINIPIKSLLLAVILLAIPILICQFFKLGLTKSLIISFARMSAQLFLIGIFLKYLFEWNNPLINIAWLVIMILVAVLSATKSSSMKHGKVILPVFISFAIATLAIILYMNIFVIHLDYILDARYLVVLGGMLLGNSLRVNIVGINTFYSNIRQNNKQYLYSLSLGATHKEAILPYLRESVRLALKPSIATMATMGIVALPGMMTGVILGGTSPELAIKYQIMIMIGIIASTSISIILTILLTLPVCFTKYGTIKSNIFVNNKQ